MVRMSDAMNHSREKTYQSYTLFSTERAAVRNTADAAILMLSKAVEVQGGYVCGIAFFDVSKDKGYNGVMSFAMVMDVRKVESSLEKVNII